MDELWDEYEDEDEKGTEVEQSIDWISQKLKNKSKWLMNCRKNRENRQHRMESLGPMESRTKFKATVKKKGLGKAYKEKGATMPTIFCLNSRCAKEWAQTQRNSKESFAALWIWKAT